MARLAEVFSPEYNAPSIGIGEISGWMNMPKTSIITLSNWLHSDDDVVDIKNDRVVEKLLRLDS